MTQAARRVRHLRLRADSAQTVRRVLPGLEDALRTATLPDSGGRLLLVRRLALGRIAADAAPASLALALERAVAAARIDCLPATAPGAEAASAVWFRDALEAHVALARRVLEGPQPSEWFWPLAVPAWSTSHGPEATIAVLAASLAERPEAAVALPAWRAALTARGHGAVLRTLPGWLEVEQPGSTPEPLEARQRAASNAADRQRAMLPTIEAGAAVPSIPRAGEAAVTALPVPLQPPRAQSALPLVAAHVPAEAAKSTSTPRPLEQAVRPEPAARPDTAVVAARSAPISESPSVSAIADVSFASPAMPSAQRDARPPAVAAEPPPADSLPIADAHIDGLPTAAGGIGFVLPVLARLGYPQWLDVHPDLADRQIARRVLACLLDRLRVGADDPAWSLVGRLDPTAGPATNCTLPASWTALALRHDRRPLVLEADAPATDRQLAALWSRAVHRWLRRQAGIGLADLILRPALIELTPTHVDVRYDLRHIELRIRRAGLDLDPGWLPWFGRVVGFHYQRLP